MLLLYVRFDPDVSLYQWKGGSRMVCGPLEGVMQLISDPAGAAKTTSIEVKVRGPRDTNRACFFFLEELLGIIDQVP
jgi:hypothetical protein